MPTLQHTTEQAHTPERQQTSTWSEAEHVVANFQFEPDFIGQLMKEGISPSDPTTREYASALSAYSESYLEARSVDETINPDLAHQITLVANAPLYVTLQKDLTHYEHKLRRGHLPNDEWADFQTLRPYVVWFNQQVSDYAYTHPNDKLSDVNKALIRSSLNSHPHDAQTVERSITDTTRGARTEAVTRQLMDIAGVPYTPGSEQEDLKGGDVMIHFKGHDIKIDIKSSLSDIAHVRGGYDEINEKHLMYAIHKRPNERVEDHVVKLYPGFEDIDLGDSLGIKPDSDFAASRSQMIVIQLMKAYHELGFKM